jgi:hypothetical protein
MPDNESIYGYILDVQPLFGAGHIRISCGRVYYPLTVF